VRWWRIANASAGRAPDGEQQRDQESDHPLVNATRKNGVPVVSLSPTGAVELTAELARCRADPLVLAGRYAEALAVYRDKEDAHQKTLGLDESGLLPISADMFSRSLNIEHSP
jgi:hypothetical protein